MKLLRSSLLCAAAAATLAAQAPPPRAEFEVASVKPSEGSGAMITGNSRVRVGIQIDGAQVHCNSLSLKDYIRIAYQVQEYQVNGPEWMASERFDIHAKLPEGSRGQFRDMLKNLLEDRFQLKLHRASKEFPVYAVTAAKSGLKLKESALDPETEGDGGHGAVNVSAEGSAAGTTVRYGRGAYLSLADNKFEAKKLTMAQLAESIARFAERPVIDQTGIQGTYDITLELTPEEYRTLLIRMAVSAGVNLPPEALRLLQGSSDESLFKGLQAVGLKLESRRAPIDVLVVDSVSKTPVQN